MILLCYIYSPPPRLSQVSHYMSQGYQNSACFLFDMEPNFAALPLDACHRKPSYDDMLCELFGTTATDAMEAPIVENIKPRGRKPASQPAPQKKEKKKRENTKTLGQGQQRGHWKIEENKRYHWFLEIHSSHFLNKHLRRMDKIFKSMERFVGSREAEQCRSHHQKMEKKYGNFVNILKELRKQIYGTGDADCIVSDMRFNGVECTEQLLSWDYLENQAQRVEQPDTEKSTIHEGSPQDCFIDPIAELNCQYEPSLELLIL